MKGQDLWLCTFIVLVDIQTFEIWTAEIYLIIGTPTNGRPVLYTGLRPT